LGFERVSGPEELLAPRDFLRKGEWELVPDYLVGRRALSSLVAAIEARGLPRERLPGIYLEGPFVILRSGEDSARKYPADRPSLAKKNSRCVEGLLKISTLALNSTV
jgi:hypothetical protein